MLSQEGFAIAWTQYQEMLLAAVNRITTGSEEYTMSSKNIVLKHARNPLTVNLFNHASMAHNNYLFFNGLSSAPEPLTKFVKLHQSLIATFGSIETLQKTMLNTANAMFGPGFVWLVWAKDIKDRGREPGAWRIMNTYLAGTPYPEAGYRQQDRDQSSLPNSGDAMNTVGRFGKHSAYGKKQAELPPGATWVQPVLCVNTWQHVYMRDFGVTGKREYLRKWWEAIDWHEVQSLTPGPEDSRKQFLQR